MNCAAFVGNRKIFVFLSTHYLLSLSKLAQLATTVVWQFYPRAGLRIVLNWFLQIETKWKELPKTFCSDDEEQYAKKYLASITYTNLVKKKRYSGEGYNIVNVTSLFCKGIPMVPLQPEELVLMDFATMLC